MSGARAPGDGAPRIVVTSGSPDDVELAAVVAALTSFTAPSGRREDVPAWRRAALIEGTGGSRVVAARGPGSSGPAAW